MTTDPAIRHTPEARSARLFGAWCAAALACVVTVGCGKQGPSLGIDELEQGRIQEQLTEISLGDFSIPIPSSYVTEDKQVKHQTFLLMRFQLWALVSPSEENRVKRLIDRNHGTLRDRVITACRRSPINDLQDPNLTALRSRLLDQLQPLFEGRLLKRVGVHDVLIDPV